LFSPFEDNPKALQAMYHVETRVTQSLVDRIKAGPAKPEYEAGITGCKKCLIFILSYLAALQRTSGSVCNTSPGQHVRILFNKTAI
jgi:hypothetical protein